MDDPDICIAEIWNSGNAEIHSVVAPSFVESMMVLLMTTAWKLRLFEEEDGVLVHDDERTLLYGRRRLTNTCMVFFVGII